MLLTLTLSLTTAAQDPGEDPVRLQALFRAALQAVSPCIVKIETVGGAPARRDGESAQVGFRAADAPTTGLVWSPDGFVITSSFNFVQDPSIITVTLHDGRRFVAKLVARDNACRLALLKVEAADLPTPSWLETGDVRVGQWALTAGFGFGSAAPAVSAGIVSGLGRMSGQAIQTDAKTSPANYGGPLFDLEGRVLGICAPMGAGEDEFAGVGWYDSGIGFAIHADQLRHRVPRLVKGQTLERGLVGLLLDQRDPVVGDDGSGPGTPAPRKMIVRGMPPPEPLPARPPDGLLVLEDPRGPAAEAGIRKGDVMIGLDGQPTPRQVDFRRIIARKAAGDPVELRFRRGSQIHTATITLMSIEETRRHMSATQPASQPAAPAEPSGDVPRDSTPAAPR